jgi:hypothetical protein
LKKIKLILLDALNSQMTTFATWLLLFIGNYFFQLVSTPIVKFLFFREKVEFIALLIFNLLFILVLFLLYRNPSKVHKRYIIASFILLIGLTIILDFYIPTHLFLYDNTLYYVSENFKVSTSHCRFSDFNKQASCLIRYYEDNDIIWNVSVIKLSFMGLFIATTFTLTFFSFYCGKLITGRAEYRAIQ